MCQNFLQLNALKTEAIMVDIPHQIQSSPRHLLWQPYQLVTLELVTGICQQNLSWQLKYKSRSVI